jgi:hypothetical protein
LNPLITDFEEVSRGNRLYSEPLAPSHRGPI